MALHKQIGIKFNLTEDWKELFKSDTWFLWNRPIKRMQIVLKRFTVWNVLRWYFYQLCIKIVVALLYPVLRMAFKYWNDSEEGEQTKVISERVIKDWETIHWFRLGEN